MYYMETQDDGSIKLLNEHLELVNGYRDLATALLDLGPHATVGDPYIDIGGFEMREVTPA